MTTTYCQMPDMDGFEATRELCKRFDPELIIVAVTANAVQGDREKCLETGMNDFIAKPVDMRELKRVLNEWVAINPH